MRNFKNQTFRTPPFALKKSRVQLEKLEERLLLSAEPLLQMGKPAQGTALAVDNVLLTTRVGDAVNNQQDPMFEVNLQNAQVIDLSKGVDQNSTLLSWEVQGDLMKLNQDLGSLVLDLGANDDTVKISQDEQGRIKVSSDGLYDLVFAKPLNLLAIRGGAGVDKVLLDTFSMGGGLRVESEFIELSKDKTVTLGGDVLLEAVSRITGNPTTGDAQGTASTLVDVQGTLVTKGLVTLSARSYVDYQTVRNGTSADLNFSAQSEARARLGESASLTAAGLSVTALTEISLVAELSGVTDGTLVLDAKQISEAALLGKPFNAANVQAAVAAAIAICDPAEDLRGDIEYKTAMAGEMVKRALHKAWALCA
jgi:hypothetical protein